LGDGGAPDDDHGATSQDSDHQRDDPQPR
jgi:hypothetical protein